VRRRWRIGWRRIEGPAGLDLDPDFPGNLINRDNPRRSIMAANPTLAKPEAIPASFVPPITPEELARRNRAAMALLDEWAADTEDEQDQRETMDVLRKALGPERIASNRPAIL
jgi:hypothetical protein